MKNKELIIHSSFEQGHPIPTQHAKKKGFSPAFQIEGLCDECETIAIIMEDLDHPFKKNFTHWIIWNIPAISDIPEHIPSGAIVESLGNAFQGVAYGKNCYKGPNPPFFSKPHRYQFTFYALDCKLDLLFSAEKHHLLKAMQGHILQTGSIIGTYHH